MKKTIYLLFIIIFAVMLSGCVVNQNDADQDNLLDSKVDENQEENQESEKEIGISKSDLKNLENQINEMDVEDLPSFTE